MSIERALLAAKSKDEMHRYIDSLAESDEALLLVSKRGDVNEADHHQYTHFGAITVERSYFLAHAFADYLMRLT